MEIPTLDGGAADLGGDGPATREPGRSSIFIARRGVCNCASTYNATER